MNRADLLYLLIHVHHRRLRRSRRRWVGMRGRSRPNLKPSTVMLNHEDLKWIATTSTELNSMLQQISRYADLARQHKGEYNYIEMLGERVELASKTAQALFDRVTSIILEGAAAKAKTRSKIFASCLLDRPPSPDASALPQSDRADRSPPHRRLLNFSQSLKLPAASPPEIPVS